MRGDYTDGGVIDVRVLDPGYLRTVRDLRLHTKAVSRSIEPNAGDRPVLILRHMSLEPSTPSSRLQKGYLLDPAAVPEPPQPLALVVILRGRQRAVTRHLSLQKAAL